MIVTEDLCKTYGAQKAVLELSFHVERGQILGLVGPNGAGKTTTLKILAGIVPPSGGRATICGHDVVHDPIQAKQRSAFIPDDPRLFDALTTWEHLEFCAAAYGVEDYEPKARQLLEEFELLEKRDALAQGLSRGMCQKLAIACGYLHCPDVILFDEPLTGLDPKGIQTVTNSIRERAAGGASVILSSHLLSLVDRICTHVLILNRGQCVFGGRIEAARELTARAGTTASFEEIFFHLTDTPDSESTTDVDVRSMPFRSMPQN